MTDQRASSERNGLSAIAPSDGGSGGGKDHEGAPWGKRCLRLSRRGKPGQAKAEVCARGALVFEVPAPVAGAPGLVVPGWDQGRTQLLPWASI